VTRRRAVGGLLVSLAVGAALIAALVDVPLFARATTYPDDQVGASLVLVRFLVALPVGALVGGLLLRRLGSVLPTSGGMLLAALAFVAMTRWDRDALDGPAASVALVVAGFGFGLAVAPVNAAVLAAVPRDAHGVASALVVVARSIGMLVGLSVLTAVGLRRFNGGLEDLPGPDVLCPRTPTDCGPYSDGVRAAVLDQLHAIFAGAAISAAVAAVLALLLARPRLERLKKPSPADD
jgi:MFS family permease